MFGFIGRNSKSHHPNQTLLPLVGPYASNTPVDYRTLSDVTVTTQINTTSSTTRTNPLKYKKLTINPTGAFYPDLITTGAIFIWANEIVITGTISAAGLEGVDESAGPGGGSGGGGGGAGDFLGQSGGAGGDGGSGNDGSGSPHGSGSIGFGLTYNSGYAWPNGGGGSAGNIPSGGGGGGGGRGGIPGSGYGGGGGGGGGGGAGIGGGIGGPGGGGGGLICLGCNRLSGAGTLDASGGPTGADGPGLWGGAGGGGVIYVFTRQYDGSMAIHSANGGQTYDASVEAGANGTASIFQITASNTLVARNWTDVF